MRQPYFINHMSINNLSNELNEERKKSEPIRGDNFVMSSGKGIMPSSSDDTSVEFRPEETNEVKIKAKEEVEKKHLNKQKILLMLTSPKIFLLMLTSPKIC